MNDLSAAGAFAVETIAFAGLVDPARGRTVPVKVHAPMDGGPFPVVIVSHGGGGHWAANYAQAHHLASDGYAVLALKHVGSDTEVFRRSFRFIANLKAMTRDTDEVLRRPKDVSFAIDQAEEWNETHDRLRGLLNLRHVGVLGRSYGACTTWSSPARGRPGLAEADRGPGPGAGAGPARPRGRSRGAEEIGKAEEAQEEDRG